MVTIRTRSNEDLKNVKEFCSAKTPVTTPDNLTLLYSGGDEDYYFRSRATAYTSANPGSQVIVEVFQNGKADRARYVNGESTTLTGAGLSWAPDMTASENKTEEEKQEEQTPVQESLPQAKSDQKSDYTLFDLPLESKPADHENEKQTPVQNEAVEDVQSLKADAPTAEEELKTDNIPATTPEPVKETETKEKAEVKKEPAIFPVDASKRKKPPLLPVPETAFTLDDVIKKLDEEKNASIPSNLSDSLWTIERLKELCEKDHDLIQYIMQPNKKFMKAFLYLYELLKSKEIGNIISLDGNPKTSSNFGADLPREEAIEYFIEYYMLDEEEQERLHKEELEKKKAEEAEKRAKAAENSKKSKRKTKTSTTADSAPAVPATPIVSAAPVVSAETSVEEKKTVKPEAPVIKQDLKSNQISFFDMLNVG